MDATNEQSKVFTTAQSYVMATLCLLVGIVVGYLLHAPKRVAAEMGSTPMAGTVANGAMPGPDQMKRMADKAAEPLLASLQKDPNNAEVLAQTASVYFRAQQFPTAVEYYDRAVKSKPSADGFVKLSNAYHYAGSDDQAIESLNSALKLDPKSPNALFNMGMLRWQVKNDPDGAITAWKELLKTNPNHPQRAQVEQMIAKAKKHVGMAAGAKTSKPAM